MKTALPTAFLLSCLSSAGLAQGSAGSSAPTPAERYRADVTCASMALAVKKDPVATPAPSAQDVSKIDDMVAETTKVALASGQAISKSPAKVTADIGAGSVPFQNKLKAVHDTDEARAEHGKLGRALIGCALSHANDVMTPTGK